MPEITLFINGDKHLLDVPSHELLLDTLRRRLHLTGAKRGCDTGDCGACTILLDGKPVNSCLVLTVEADGCRITTIEGIDHPIQEIFARYNAFQCGYCAPGIVVSSTALLENGRELSPEKIRRELSGHLCRCTGYQRILQALLGEEPRYDQVATQGSIGKPVVRKDIRAKVTGRAQYTADLYFPGLVYGALVTSPHPYARILHVDPGPALELEGVVLALTAADVPQTPYGVSPARYDETILPQDFVRHVGEPVAAVFAETPELAEQAAELVRVEYEPLQPVTDPARAQEPQAPQLHERFPRNVNTEIHHDFGDVEQAFAQAKLVREDVFQGQRTHQAYLEPPAALALVEDDLIQLWTASQTPHYVQYQVARVLDIPMSRLRVIKPAMGGGFGGKAEVTKLDFLAVIAAERLRRPVLMVMDRRQVFHHGRGRHAQEMKLKTAFDKEGRLLGTHAEITLDGGAYTSYGIITAYYSGALLTIPYELPNFRFDGYRVHTNLPTCGAQRGNGTPQPRFAFESQLDMTARDLGIDPLTLRLRNAIGPGHRTVNDLQVTSCAMRECLEKLDEIADFRRKYGKLPFGKGIGMAAGSFISGAAYPIVRGDLPHSACTLRVAEDGQRVFLHTQAPDIGQGSDTVLCQIAASALGVEYEQVSILAADTALGPIDLGAYASRVTFMVGNAIVSAAQEIKHKLTQFWREEINSNAQDLTFTDGNISDGATTRPFHEVAREYYQHHGPLLGAGSYSPPPLGGKFKGAAVGPSPAYSFCAIAAEVTVDPETGQVQVDHFYAAHDSGTVINPATFLGQVEGALVMGQGETLLEKVVQHDGHLRNPNFHDYLLPTFADAPEITSVAVDSTDPNGPFGAKEVGEGTILPVMGAIANAVFDAVAVRVTSLPITPQKILQGLGKLNGA